MYPRWLTPTAPSEVAERVDSDDDERLYRLIRPIAFSPTGHRRDMVWAPVGFVSDGASTPNWLWGVFPPDDPQWFGAAVLHDRLYRLCMRCGRVPLTKETAAEWVKRYPDRMGHFLRPNTEMFRDEADMIFAKAMLASGADPGVVAIFHAAVRVAGWIAW